MAAGRITGARIEQVVERFLAGCSTSRTRQAYAVDLRDFARFRGKTPAEAVAELLAGREQGHRLVLEFAVELPETYGVTAARLFPPGAEGQAVWVYDVPSDVTALELAPLTVFCP